MGGSRAWWRPHGAGVALASLAWLVLAAALAVPLALLPRAGNACRMTYSRPVLHELRLPDAVHRAFPGYRVLRYNNGAKPEEEMFSTAGQPVVFVPGHLGSFRQARSMASQLDQRAPGRFEHFTLDFAEDPSAVSGWLATRQAQFLAVALRRIAAQYPAPAPPLVLVAHSMGGIAARLAMRLLAIEDAHVPRANATAPVRVSVLVALATPQTAPPLVGDGAMRGVFATLPPLTHSGAGYVLSVAGGYRDQQVPSHLVCPASPPCVWCQFGASSLDAVKRCEEPAPPVPIVPGSSLDVADGSEGAEGSEDGQSSEGAAATEDGQGTEGDEDSKGAAATEDGQGSTDEAVTERGDGAAATEDGQGTEGDEDSEGAEGIEENAVTEEEDAPAPAASGDKGVAVEAAAPSMPPVAPASLVLSLSAWDLPDGVSTDHQAVLWCDQVLRPVAAALSAALGVPGEEGGVVVNASRMPKAAREHIHPTADASELSARCAAGVAWAEEGEGDLAALGALAPVAGRAAHFLALHGPRVLQLVYGLAALAVAGSPVWGASRVDHLLPLSAQHLDAALALPQVLAVGAAAALSPAHASPAAHARRLAADASRAVRSVAGASVVVAAYLAWTSESLSWHGLLLCQLPCLAAIYVLASTAVATAICLAVPSVNALSRAVHCLRCCRRGASTAPTFAVWPTLAACAAVVAAATAVTSPLHIYMFPGAGGAGVLLIAAAHATMHAAVLAASGTLVAAAFSTTALRGATRVVLGLLGLLSHAPLLYVTGRTLFEISHGAPPLISGAGGTLELLRGAFHLAVLACALLVTQQPRPDAAPDQMPSVLHCLAGESQQRPAPKVPLRRQPRPSHGSCPDCFHEDGGRQCVLQDSGRRDVVRVGSSVVAGPAFRVVKCFCWKETAIRHDPRQWCEFCACTCATCQEVPSRGMPSAAEAEILPRGTRAWLDGLLVALARLVTVGFAAWAANTEGGRDMTHASTVVFMASASMVARAML